MPEPDIQEPDIPDEDVEKEMRAPSTATAARIHPAIRIPPPLLFVLTFLGGVGLQRLEPLDVNSAGVVEAANTAGIGLVAFGLLLALSCMGIFLWARTTLVPHGTAAKLITGGPYRYTRNPMYVSLVAVYLGVDGIRAGIWPLLLLPLPIIIVSKFVIPFEENRLKQLFGNTFEQYCAKVRRWL